MAVIEKQSSHTNSPWSSYRLMERIRRALIFLAATIGFVVMIWPIAWTILTSLKHPQEVHRYPMTWLPDNWFYFENYRILFTEYPIWRWLLNSVIVTSY